MRLVGWCEQCRKIRPVRVSSAALARMPVSGIAVGVCAQCEDDNDKKARQR